MHLAARVPETEPAESTNQRMSMYFCKSMSFACSGSAALIAYAIALGGVQAQGGLPSPSPTSPGIDVNNLKVPPPGAALPKGGLSVTKATARKLAGGTHGVPPQKVAVFVEFCIRNTGDAQIAGPIYTKFFWQGTSPSNSTPPVPGMQGTPLAVRNQVLAGKADACGEMKLTFDSPQTLDQIGALKKSPKVRAWVPFTVSGNTAVPAPDLVYLNNPRDVVIMP
jgi:hypothetical protein